MAQGARNTTAIPPPPRLSGEYASDQVALTNWFTGFYQAAVVQSGLLDPSFQLAVPPEFDPAALPDPSDTTISRAQQTANEAYELAETAEAKALHSLVTFTLSGTNNQTTLTFGTPFDDDAYRVVIVPRTYTGTPDLDAFIVTKVVRTAESVVIDFGDAPGVGTTISFDALFFLIQ